MVPPLGAPPILSSHEGAPAPFPKRGQQCLSELGASPKQMNPSAWRNRPHSHVKHRMLNLSVRYLGSLAQPWEHSRPQGRCRDASQRLGLVCKCRGLPKQRPSDLTHACHTGKRMPSCLLSRARGWSQISRRDGITSPPNMVCL